MSTTYTLTAGKYVITDACSAHDDYYYNFLLSKFEDLGRHESGKYGSTLVVGTGTDGCGEVRELDGEIVGQFGMDAANVSVVPYKLTGPVPDHYGTVVEFDTDFDVVVYHDAMIVGNRYRVRY